jgi:GntR family transcriptional regulator / MocR family aminotransferase
LTDLHDLIDARRFRREALLANMPLQRALYERLKLGIMQGRVQAGAVLPSTRVLSQELGISRNGVIHAYEQLAAEGYIVASKQGSVVAALAFLRVPEQRAVAVPRPGHAGALRTPSLSARVAHCHRLRAPEFDMRPFMPGVPALDAFPMGLWRRLSERAARQAQPIDLCYRHAVGEPELRQAIATYMRAARGVRCHADQVTVTDGTQHSMALCAQLLADPGDTIWIEHPGYGGARTAFEQAGLKLRPVTVDADGMAPPFDWWHLHTPRFIYTTPAHQYPLGSVLSLPRRLQLIDQGRRVGAWILEDDYDGEFRHDGPPLPAMQGQVDDAPVVYLGTFSKSMFPGLRLGFIIWPQALADRAAAVLGEVSRQGRTIEQRALAAFIDEGHFTRHLRRMRKLYAGRQAALREALPQHWPWPSTLLGGQAGMHVVLAWAEQAESINAATEGGWLDLDVAAAAAQAGLGARPLRAYSTGGIGGFNGLVMGYANTHEDQVASAMRRLADAARACTHQAPRPQPQRK